MNRSQKITVAFNVCASAVFCIALWFFYEWQYRGLGNWPAIYRLAIVGGILISLRVVKAVVDPAPKQNPRGFPVILPGRDGGFTFIEVLFAVILLGIGFTMIAGIFPVAIQQS